MILIIPLFAGLLVGKLVGGRFKSLGAISMRLPELLLAGFAIQLVLYTPLCDSQSWDIRYGHYLYVLSLALVLGVLLLNLGRLGWPVLIMAAGAFMNLLVIVANGGAMPVNTKLLAQAQGAATARAVLNHTFATNVTAMTSSTPLAFLGDHIRITASVYSVGDITLGLGAFALAIVAMCSYRRAPESVPAMKTVTQTA